MKCFYCGSLQSGEKCSLCGGRLEEEAAKTSLKTRELTEGEKLFRGYKNTPNPNCCCSDCGQRLVRASTKHAWYLSDPLSFYTVRGTDKNRHFFEVGSVVRRVIYECPNRGWWRCRVQKKYYLWPDETLTL